nr:MAG TPA: hypothetical protein [Caudoviricetes sp.]
MSEYKFHSFLNNKFKLNVIQIIQILVLNYVQNIFSSELK